MAERPDTEPLLTLLALAEAGSESAAAESLGIGQSSVSRRLATLQRLSSEPLTQRTAGGSKLTAAGERLLPYAREVRASLTVAARLLAADEAGPLALRFGIVPELAPRFAGPLVNAVSEHSAPEVAGILKPTFSESSNEQLLAGVRSGNLHAGLVTWAPAGREPGLEATRIAGDRLVLIGSPGGELFHGDNLNPAALRERTLLLPRAESGLGLRALAALRGAGLEPKATVSLGSQTAVLAACQAGAGVGVVLASACVAEVTAGWLASAPLAGDEASIDVWLLLSTSLNTRDEELVRGLVNEAVALAAGPS